MLRWLKIWALCTALTLFVLGGGEAAAQLYVTPGTNLAGWTADSLVQNVLVGGGVHAYNCRFNGSTSINSMAIGEFHNGMTMTNLGIVSGVHFSTGNIANAVGTRPTDDYIQSWHNVPEYSDENCPIYNYVSSSASQCADLAVLEFDFIPKSDSIRFRYVFASEEYPDFVCSPYNDVFGFFVSGPNPSGGSYVNKNVALIPGTSLPISINNVNDGVDRHSVDPSMTCNYAYSQYYVNNMANQQYRYRGITTPLTAELKVIPCLPYHITMCIIDVGDSRYDSGVFLQARSFTSNSIQATFNNPANPGQPDHFYEGCCQDLVLTRPQRMSTATLVTVTMEGTAINGEDYSAIPSFGFPANTDTVIIPICPFDDGITEGEESVMFIFTSPNSCPDTAIFYIVDKLPLTATVERGSLEDFPNTVQLTAHVTGGSPAHMTTWTSRATGARYVGDEVTVPTLPVTWFDVRVTDSCGDVYEDSVWVGIYMDYTLHINDTLVCIGDSVDFWVAGFDSVFWSFNGVRQPGPTDRMSFAATADTLVTVEAVVWWHGLRYRLRDTALVAAANVLPSFHVTASADSICPGDPVRLTATGANSYSWDQGVTFVADSTFTVRPEVTGPIVVWADGGGCRVPKSVFIFVDSLPLIRLQAPAGVCNGEPVAIVVEPPTGRVHWSSTPVDPSIFSQDYRDTIEVLPEVTTLYTATISDAVCTVSASHSISVEPTPTAVGKADPAVVEIGEMHTRFIDMSADATSRLWVLPDGTTSVNSPFEYEVPINDDTLLALLIAYNAYYCADTAKVIVTVDRTTVWAPNAFTPDEATNQTFLVKMTNVMDYSICIYNRAGLLVFASNDPERPWDGRTKTGEKCPEAAYTYIVRGRKTTYPYEIFSKAGTVLLIR